MSTIDIAVSSVGIVIAMASFAVSYLRASKEDVRELEHRLTTLEVQQNMLGFNENDRKCLQELKVKNDVVWNVLEVEFPKILRQERTPEIDELLDKVSVVGLRGLTKEEYEKLDKLISIEYDMTLMNESNPARAIVLALFKSVVNYSKNNGILLSNCKGT